MNIPPLRQAFLLDDWPRLQELVRRHHRFIIRTEGAFFKNSKRYRREMKHSEAIRRHIVWMIRKAYSSVNPPVNYWDWATLRGRRYELGDMVIYSAEEDERD